MLDGGYFKLRRCEIYEFESQRVVGHEDGSINRIVNTGLMKGFKCFSDMVQVVVNYTQFLAGPASIYSML